MALFVLSHAVSPTPHPTGSALFLSVSLGRRRGHFHPLYLCPPPPTYTHPKDVFLGKHSPVTHRVLRESLLLPWSWYFRGSPKQAHPASGKGRPSLRRRAGSDNTSKREMQAIALWCRREDVPFLFAATMTNVHLCFMVKRQATLCMERFQEDSGWALEVLQGLHCTACYL